MSELLSIGFGNQINKSVVVAIVSPDAAPIKRMVIKAKEEGNVIDATAGRKTRAVITTINNKVILSALTTDTLTQRFTRN